MEDKVVCIKDLYVDNKILFYNKKQYHIKINEFNIDGIINVYYGNDIFDFFPLFIYDKIINDNIKLFKVIGNFYNFQEYFISLKELRKNKLNKLSKFI